VVVLAVVAGFAFAGISFAQNIEATDEIDNLIVITDQDPDTDNPDQMGKYEITIEMIREAPPQKEHL
jgi:hypothetical protein